MAAHHRKQHQAGRCLKWLETKFSITDSDDCLDYYKEVRSKIQEQMYAGGLCDSKNPWLKGPNSHSLKAACLELRNSYPGIDLFRVTRRSQQRDDDDDGESENDHMINVMQKISYTPKDDPSQKLFLRAGIVAGVSSNKPRLSIKLLKLDAFIDLVKQRSTFHDKQNLTVGYAEVDCDSAGKGIWVRVTTDLHFQLGILQMMNANKDVEFFIGDDGIKNEALQDRVVIKIETSAAGTRDVGTQTADS